MWGQDGSDGGSDWGGRVDQIGRMLKFGGKAVAGPMVKEFIRTRVVRILSQRDPSTLQNYILTDYALVENDTPPKVRNVLGNIGPQFSEEIQELVTPERVLGWLEEPEEWMDVAEHPERAADIRECYQIIKNTPGGEEWLEEQCIAVYEIAGVL